MLGDDAHLMAFVEDRSWSICYSAENPTRREHPTALSLKHLYTRVHPLLVPAGAGYCAQWPLVRIAAWAICYSADNSASRQQSTALLLKAL